jgi:hypothetical protein
MVRTLTGMAKPEPEPKPHAAGAAQDSTVRFATLPNAPQWCVAGAPLAISIRNRLNALPCGTRPLARVFRTTARRAGAIENSSASHYRSGLALHSRANFCASAIREEVIRCASLLWWLAISASSSADFARDAAMLNHFSASI